MIGQALRIPPWCRPPPALPAPQGCWQPRGARHVALCTWEAFCFLYPREILTELWVCGVAAMAACVCAWCRTVPALLSGAPGCFPCGFGSLQDGTWMKPGSAWAQRGSGGWLWEPGAQPQSWVLLLSSVPWCFWVGGPGLSWLKAFGGGSAGTSSSPSLGVWQWKVPELVLGLREVPEPGLGMQEVPKPGLWILSGVDFPLMKTTCPR